jgi:GNAT superfamily N-acetyltransferase
MTEWPSAGIAHVANRLLETALQVLSCKDVVRARSLLLDADDSGKRSYAGAGDSTSTDASIFREAAARFDAWFVLPSTMTWTEPRCAWHTSKVSTSGAASVLSLVCADDASLPAAVRTDLERFAASISDWHVTPAGKERFHPNSKKAWMEVWVQETDVSPQDRSGVRRIVARLSVYRAGGELQLWNVAVAPEWRLHGIMRRMIVWTQTTLGRNRLPLFAYAHHDIFEPYKRLGFRVVRDFVHMSYITLLPCTMPTVARTDCDAVLCSPPVLGVNTRSTFKCAEHDGVTKSIGRDLTHGCATFVRYTHWAPVISDAKQLEDAASRLRAIERLPPAFAVVQHEFVGDAGLARFDTAEDHDDASERPSKRRLCAEHHG